jgi:hypothetical protein
MQMNLQQGHCIVTYATAEHSRAAVFLSGTPLGDRCQTIRKHGSTTAWELALLLSSIYSLSFVHCRFSTCSITCFNIRCITLVLSPSRPLLILCRFPLFDAAYFVDLRPLTVVVYDAGAYSHQNGPGGGVSNNPEVAIAR